MAAELTFNHIKETCLYIRDIDKAEEFYHKTLGLPMVSKQEGRHIFFRTGSSMLLCFIAENTKNETRFPAHFGEGKQHMAFGVPLKDYEAWKARFNQLGITITHEHTWSSNIKSFYFEDPDGNVLEVVPDELWDKD